MDDMKEVTFPDKEYQLKLLNTLLECYPQLYYTNELSDNEFKNIIYLFHAGFIFMDGDVRRDIAWFRAHNTRVMCSITPKGIQLLTGYSLENND